MTSVHHAKPSAPGRFGIFSVFVVVAIVVLLIALLFIVWMAASRTAPAVAASASEVALSTGGSLTPPLAS